VTLSGSYETDETDGGGIGLVFTGGASFLGGGGTGGNLLIILSKTLTAKLNVKVNAFFMKAKDF
jgi:hypothetical protein